MDQLQVRALSDEALAACLREVDDKEGFHLFVTEALARALTPKEPAVFTIDEADLVFLGACVLARDRDGQLWRRDSNAIDAEAADRAITASQFLLKRCLQTPLGPLPPVKAP